MNGNKSLHLMFYEPSDMLINRYFKHMELWSNNILYSYFFIPFQKDCQLCCLELWCAMSPQRPYLLHREAFSEAHGPSSLRVDLVNYLGCQGLTTAYPQRGRGGRIFFFFLRGGGYTMWDCEKKRGSVRERERNHCRGLEQHWTPQVEDRV